MILFEEIRQACMVVHAGRVIEEKVGDFVAINSGFAGKPKGLNTYLKSFREIAKGPKKPEPRKTVDDLFSLAQKNGPRR